MVEAHLCFWGRSPKLACELRVTQLVIMILLKVLLQKVSVTSSVMDDVNMTLCFNRRNAMTHKSAVTQSIPIVLGGVQQLFSRKDLVIFAPSTVHSLLLKGG